MPGWQRSADGLWVEAGDSKPKIHMIHRCKWILGKLSGPHKGIYRVWLPGR